MSSQVLRMSQLFLRTLRDDPADADVTSAKLLIRAGYIRKVGPGLYSWLPLGLKVLRKIENVIREELAVTGAQEVDFPVLLPKDPYEATHRWEEYGDNIFRVKDRHDAEYLLVPTAEEMFTLMVKDMYSSYKDLPVTLYQIESKYRDEFRPRAGMIRGREFIMQDAYSFDMSEEDLKKSYEIQRDAYERIFKRLKVDYVMVHAMSGPMGGFASEEFLAPLPIGEDTFALAPSGTSWNVEALTTVKPEDIDFSETEDMVALPTPDSPTIESLVDQANALHPRTDGRTYEASDTLKNLMIAVMHPTGEREIVAIGVPGDRQVDMKRLEASFTPAEIEEATPEDLAKFPELVKGYIGPGVLGPQNTDEEGKSRIKYLLDAHIARGSEWITGADKPETHVFHAVYGRDFEADGFVEAVEVRSGDMSPDGSGPLSLERGVEIGQVFQLGLKYSEALGLNVLNENGKAVPVWMGSYGIGVSRVMSCIAEYHNDENGLMWPAEVAPAQVHVIATGRDQMAFDTAEKLVEQLAEMGIEVIYDDRPKVSPGIKFKDSELLGMPLIAVSGRDTVANGTIEIRHRDGSDTQIVPIAEAAELLKNSVKALM
ncbi:proline--tRNA ligase [Alloscardovia criceti]|uniref:proline--tRNA ligase n=1 Tax=Alloscardovia criceti TaxID=356828 RepID=UPI0004776BF3|nr:proline--tRNA ligase [Alloscardovia criceti]